MYLLKSYVILKRMPVLGVNLYVLENCMSYLFDHVVQPPDDRVDYIDRISLFLYKNRENKNKMFAHLGLD